MSKVITVKVGAFILGQPTWVKNLKGSVEEVMGELTLLCPNKSFLSDVKPTLIKAVFSDSLEWCCNHGMSLEVTSVRTIKPLGVEGVDPDRIL